MVVGRADVIAVGAGLVGGTADGGFAQHGQLEAALKALPVTDARGIRLDLTNLAYISSMGMRVVMKLMKDLRAQKAVFQMVNLQPQIKKVFEIAAALPKEEVFKNVEEADAYLDLMQKRVLRGEAEH